MLRDLADSLRELSGPPARPGRACRLVRGGLLTVLLMLGCDRSARQGPPSGSPAPGSVTGRATLPIVPVAPSEPYWKPAIEPTLAAVRSLKASAAELRAQRDSLKRSLATLEAARETAAWEAARTRNEVVSLLLQEGCPFSGAPDCSRPETLRDLTEWLMYGGLQDGKFVRDRRYHTPPPMLRMEDYAPVELHVDALDRLEHLPRHKGQVEAAIRTLDEYLKSASGDGPFALPDDVARAYALEISLRGARSQERLTAIAAEFSGALRSALARLEHTFTNGWRGFPAFPGERLPQGTEWEASAWRPWPGTQVIIPWRFRIPQSPRESGVVGLDHTAQFKAGEPLRALLMSFEEADQILRVLSSDAQSTAAQRESYRLYREQLGDRIVEPFAKEATERASAGDLDALLDCLETLHALPIRAPAMERLRTSFASLFPEAGPSATFEARVRARRFRELASELYLATLPPSPSEFPSPDNHADLGEPQIMINAGVEVVALALSADGVTLVAIRYRQADRAYALPSVRVIGEFDVFSGNQAGSFQDRTSVAFSADGSRLAAASASDTVRLFKTSDWSLVRDLRPEERKGVDTLAFSPGEGLLLVGQSGRIRLYNSDGDWLGGEAFPYDDLFGRFRKFSDDSRLALIEGRGQSAINLAARRAEPLLGTLGGVVEVDGSFARGIFRLGRGALAFVDLRGPDPVRKVDRSVRLAAFSGDGQVLVHQDLYWERDYGNPSHRLLFRHAPNWNVFAQVGIPDIGDLVQTRPLPNGREIVLVGEYGIAVADIASGRARTIRLPFGVGRHALSADGRTVAIVGSRDKNTIKIWQFPPGPGELR